MNKDCSTCICKEGSCYPSTTIFDKDKTCKSYEPDYESYITELEKENAELKAGRPQWHDLRKDPNDLPKATTPVLVILESGVPYVSWISSDKGWWLCTNYYTGEDKVIAWKEIVLPELPKENK